ncbi:MAG: ion transporter [Duncaniella sp.]|nr:ion transporter [Duncaniella sp.]
MSTFKEKVENFKLQLARALDDDLHTRQWHNLVDYLIIAMILISTAEIFLSTFDIDPALRRVLFWVDIVVLIFFTVEVSLRIWVAPIVNPKYKGFKGRLKYCFSFYGMIDVVSTYPFYLSILFPLPFGILRVFRLMRVVRLFRISRYMKSFRLLNNAMREKRRELWISLQFLVIITIILSLLLFFFEHEAQPEVYDNGIVSVAWAFAQYIGDPGSFADTPPITFWGHAIACIVGVLGIAIVAVPAGIIGAGFTEAIERDRREEELAANIGKIHDAFERKLDRPTGFQAVPTFRTLADLQARLGLKQDEIVEVAENLDDCRLINLSSTLPLYGPPADILAMEHFLLNTCYGCCIDRGSAVTVISPSSMIDAGVGNFAFYLAMMGGFNYISRELGQRAPYKSYYAYPPGADRPGLAEYNADLERLMDRPGAWGITILVASGAQEPVYDTHIHVNIGGPKGDTELRHPVLVSDMERYRRFYDMLSEDMQQEFGLATDQQKYHATSSPNLFARQIRLRDDASNIIMRFDWKYLLWDPRRLLIAQSVARIIATTLTDNPDLPDIPTLKKKDIGFNGYEC